MKRRFSTISPSQFYGSKRFKSSTGQSISPNFAKLSKRLDRAVANRVRGKRSKRRSAKRGGKGKYMSRVVTSPSHGVSYTRTNVVYRKTGINMTKLTQPSLYKGLSQTGITSEWNKQGVQALGVSFGSKAQLQFLFDRTAKAITTTGYTGSSLVDNQASFKFYLDSVVSNYIFTNQAPTDCELEIYDCVSKITSSSYNSPTYCWDLGINEADQDPLATQTITFPKSIPTESKLFNITWKCVKKVTINISPGRSHDHTFVHKMNRLVDTSYMMNYNMVKGITNASFIVVRGALGDSNNNNTVGSVGYTPAKVIGIHEQRFVTRILNEHPRIYGVGSGLIAAEPANVWTQDEGSGAPQNIGPAFRTTYA